MKRKEDTGNARKAYLRWVQYCFTSRRESRTGDSIDVARGVRFLIKTEGQGYFQSAFSEVTDRNYAEITI